MRKPEFIINIINAVFLSLILLIGLWNLTIFYFPVLFLTVITGFILIRNYSSVIPVSVTAISFFLLLLYEVVSFQFSAYQANSILFLRDFLIILCCLFLIDKLLRSEKYRTYFVVFVSLMAGLLALFNIPIFFFRYIEAGIYGFDDFTQFRFLYMPLGLFSNEWVTTLFCFLPFPLIGLFLLWRKKIVRYGFLLIVGLIVFNIFISFSRSGFLAFLLFSGLLNLFLYVNRILPIKKILLGNTALILFSFLFALFFSESVRSSVYQTNSHQRSTEGRFKQWEEVSTLTYKYPAWGIGSKNYALLGRQSQQADLENSFRGRLNNIYIQLIIEKGGIGALLWLSVIGILIFRLFQQMRNEKKLPDKAVNCILLSAVLAILFREIFFSTLLYNNGVLLLFFVLLIFGNRGGKAIQIRKPIVIALAVIFALGAVYVYIKKPDNALIYATKGLDYEHSVTQAIQQYKEACRLSPYDALFQHNLGRLYYLNHQPDSAIIYLSQAIKTDPNTAIYRISKGLIIESQQPEQAFEHYKQAILLSPDIVDSHFFKDLEERNPIQAKKILQNACKELSEIQSIRYSSVIEAKLGKILLTLGDTEAAYKTLTNVTQIHPNLSRPWYYLGYMEQLKGNETAMQEYYKKSLFLSPFDHLPLYAFAAYYKEMSDSVRSDSYYKSAERAWKNKRSAYSLRCKRMYYVDMEKDNVIPQGLLDYISPVFELKNR